MIRPEELQEMTEYAHPTRNVQRMDEIQQEFNPSSYPYTPDRPEGWPDIFDDSPYGTPDFTPWEGRERNPFVDEYSPAEKYPNPYDTLPQGMLPPYGMQQMPMQPMVSNYGANMQHMPMQSIFSDCGAGQFSDNSANNELYNSYRRALESKGVMQ